MALDRGGRTVLRGVDLALHAGQRVAVTGPSGSGKTSLLDAMAGLLRSSSGEVQRAADLRPWDVQKLYRDPPSAFPPARLLRRTLRDVERRHCLPSDRLPDLLERLGIAPELLDRRPAEVSGGELQRIALARVMALRPAVILADEPTSRLDLVTQRRLMDLLGEVAEEHGLGVVLVTHDPDIAANWAHRVLDVAGLAGP